MNNSRVKGLRAAALRTALAAVFLLTATAAAHARQRPRHPPPRPRAPNMNPSIRERQIKMMEMERELSKPAARKDAELALTQISEDYERIQMVNNRMMADAFNAPVPDYGSVASATAEIGKRAGRLKSNLHLPPPSESEKRQTAAAEPADAAALKKLLLSLDTSLMSFVKSPVFNSVDVLDAGAAAKARGDLEAVIELSHFISKCAEKMAKPAGKR